MEPIVLPYGKSFTLSEADQELIKDMSNKICNQDRSYFEDNFKVDQNTELYDMNINGFGAEMVFCYLCGVKFDSSSLRDENHFNKADAVLLTGKTVDVKSTIYNTGKLLIRAGKEKKKVDIYVLLIGKFPSFKFVGWVPYSEIIKTENINPKFNAYCLSQDQLIKTLMIRN